MSLQQLLIIRVLIVGLKKELLELAMSVNDESEIYTRESLFKEIMKNVESCNEIEEISAEKWSIEEKSSNSWCLGG